MNIIVRNESRVAKLIKNVKNFSVDSNNAGVFIEVDNYKEVLEDLANNGFNPILVGRIINCDAISASCFDEA